MRPEHPDCPCPVCAQFRHGQDVDGVLLVAVGVAVVLVGLVWLAGQVAGLLAGGGWPEVSLAELPGILARLPRHLADPSGAWPAAVRGRLPGPAGMYAALALLSAVPVLLGTLAVWVRRRRTIGPWPATPRRGRRHRDPGGHWGALR
jgi:type IV secretion system protein VirD4